MQIIRYTSNSKMAALGVLHKDRIIGHIPAHIQLHDLLRMKLGELHLLIEDCLHTDLTADAPLSLLAPLDGKTEVWAAGVTYKQSEEARKEESETPDIYAKVYTAQRPELFFKATPRRVAAPGTPVVIRSDSTWDVPEPELVIVVNAHAEIIGYTIGNDVSSRSIEGENPLYLPQAKVYSGCCALGPGITPAWEISDPYSLGIQLCIERKGQMHWRGSTNTRELKRRFDELIDYLFREDDFPEGVMLCTGTALVPERPFTLEPGDVVQIAIEHLGILSNPVVVGNHRLVR